MEYKTLSGQSGMAEHTADDELPSYNVAVGEGATAMATVLASASTAVDDKRRPLSVDDSEPFATAVPGLDPEAGPSSPPSYTRHDPTTRTYFLRPPVVYSSSASSSASSASPNSTSSPSYPPPPPPPSQNPIYHLSAVRVHTIALAPLTPSNSRLIARKGSHTLDAIGRTVRTVPFDEDVALYQCTYSSTLLGAPLRSLEIESLKKPLVLPLSMMPMPPAPAGGTIRFEPGTASPGAAFLWSAVSGRFVVMRRRRTRTRTRERTGSGAGGADVDPEDEKRMHKYGWKPQEEWDREVLFVIARGGRRRFSSGSSSGSSAAGATYEWKDRSGRVLAHESVNEDGAFRLDLVDGEGEGHTEGAEGTGRGSGVATKDEMGTRVMREVLVTCWVGRIWASGGISLEK